MDTSRNSKGATVAEGQHEWYNPAGRRLCVPSSIGVGGADYLLCIKVPGDPNGSCGVGQGPLRDVLTVPDGRAHRRIADPGRTVGHQPQPDRAKGAKRTLLPPAPLAQVFLKAIAGEACSPQDLHVEPITATVCPTVHSCGATSI
ncbi:hypothetical protein AB0N97_19080 [Streptomyces collinus]